MQEKGRKEEERDEESIARGGRGGEKRQKPGEKMRIHFLTIRTVVKIILQKEFFFPTTEI